jgi:hypothetical protein
VASTESASTFSTFIFAGSPSGVVEVVRGEEVLRGEEWRADEERAVVPGSTVES